MSDSEVQKLMAMFTIMADDISSIKSDITDIKSDITNMKSDIKRIDKNVSYLCSHLFAPQEQVLLKQA